MPPLLKFLGVVGTVVGFRVGLVELSQVIGLFALPVMLAALIGTAVIAGELLHRWRKRVEAAATADLARWEATAGWEPAPLDTPWPWLELVRWSDTVTVLRAYREKEVTVGELAWTENALGEAVDRWSGRATFAVLTLPDPRPSMAVRAFRHPRRTGDDEFWQRFRVLGAESVTPDLRAAHLNGEVPPWTLIGDKLFIFLPLDGLLGPTDLEQAAATLDRLTQAL